MRTKIEKILSIVLIGIMVGSIPALAGLGSTTWDGNGADSVGTCKVGEAPYMHWIFTKDGYNLDPNSVMLTLVVSGIESAPVAMTQSGSGSYDYDLNSASYGPIKLAGTHVDYDVIEAGNGNLVLTISGGCTGTQVPEFPSVAFPIAAVIGLVFFFQQKKGKVE